MHDYKHTSRPRRDPDAIVALICAISALGFAVMLWAGVV